MTRDKSKPNPIRGESARNILGLFTIVKLVKEAESIRKEDENFPPENEDGTLNKG